MSGDEAASRPEVVVNGRQLRNVTDDLDAALVAANDPPVIFVREGVLTRVRVDEHGRPAAEPLTVDTARARLAEVADTVRATKDGRVHVFPPLDPVRNLLARGRHNQLPALEAVVETPTLRPDGTVHADAGWDPATRVLHVPAPTLDVPPIPDRPSPSDLTTAVALIDDLLADFPWETDADRANAWALLLTPFLRPAVAGQVPLALIDAPEPGTGKGLLATVVARLATGHSAEPRPLSAHEDEVRKTITSALARGPALVVFDNVEVTIRSSALASVLTADTISDRELGRTGDITVRNRATWIATGNALAVGGDLARRCYRIRLNARQARPWARQGFRHADLEAHVADCRGEFVAAVLIVARAWWAAGRPPADVPALGGFTPWAKTLGAILAHAGVNGFLDNLAAFHDQADADALEWEAWLTAWRDRFAGWDVTVAQLVEDMDVETSPLRGALPGRLTYGRPDFPKQLGQAIRARAGRHFGTDGLQVVPRGRNRAKVAIWTVTTDRDDARLMTAESAEMAS